MYGRLRDLCSALSGRIASHMLTVGGFPVYEGFSVPETLSPFGMVGPYREDSGTIATESGTFDGVPSHPNVKVRRIIETEQALYAARPDATHFRYPWIYGPDQPTPWEWSIVRRVVDGRRSVSFTSNLSLPQLTCIQA